MFFLVLKGCCVSADDCLLVRGLEASQRVHFLLDFGSILFVAYLEELFTLVLFISNQRISTFSKVSQFLGDVACVI